MKKLVWMEGDPLDDWPKGLKKQAMRVEPSAKGFWCYYDGHRSAGHLPETPFHNTLLWLVEQIALGNFAASRDEYGEEVTVAIGKGVSYPAASEKEAVEEAGAQALGLSIAGVVAELREKGFRLDQQELHRRIWKEGTPSAFRRMEMHYALGMARLLGRISKKLPELEQLPIVDSALETTRAYIAEATRCYLLKLDRACIALCRACLEDTLMHTLTPTMNRDWHVLMAENSQRCGKPNPMHALIEVCAEHGILKNLKLSAHYVRDAGNKVLHLKQPANEQQDLPGEVLRKTRTIVGLIYGGGTSKPSDPHGTQR